tara:strand:+ start:3836 stop:4996 length:1161 start_codon:yes stop_codon:yes gene_type:complete
MEENKFTVKDVSGVEKSKAEVEETLLKEHEEKFETSESDTNVERVDASTESAAPNTEQKEVQPEGETQEKTTASELNDADVLSYIKNRYDKDIDSVDQLFEEQKSNEDLPEDVAAYFKYKKETGRGIKDFVELQKDYNEMDGDQVLTAYYATTEEGLDSEDIRDIMDEKFSFDEELDDPKDIKKKKLAKKRELVKAKKFLIEQQDKYKAPLESSGGGLSGVSQEELDSYKSYVEESKTTEEARKKRYDYFLNKTNEVFNDEFKGFEFNIGEKSFTFKPGDKDELRSKQSDVNNFVNKYMDTDSGLMKDAQGYHRAMAVAMNLDKFAEFFYNQGMTAAVDDVSKKSKNINMDMRKTPQTFSKDGLKIRAIGDKSSGRGLKIKSIKRV